MTEDQLEQEALGWSCWRRLEMLPLRLFKFSFITSRHIKNRFNMARIHERTLASLVAADRRRLPETETRLEDS